MKGLFFLFLLIVSVSFNIFSQTNKVISVETSNTSLVYTVGNDERLVFRHYGERLYSNNDFEKIRSSHKPDTDRDFSYDAYPYYGLGNINEPAISIIFEDGSLIIELYFVSEHTEQLTQNELLTTVILKDSIYGLSIELQTKSFYNEDIIKQRVVVFNECDGDVELRNIYSSFIGIKADEYYLKHFSGAWAGEMNLEKEKLGYGIKTIESKKGVRTTQTENPSFILSLDQEARETTGRCYGGALAWSGNYRINFQIDEWGFLNILSGINPFMSNYTLKPGETFETPWMIYSFSNEGIGVISRNFHDWGRTYYLTDGFAERPIVLNSWEGAYFDFDEDLLVKMIDEAADMGVEMFVLDDGWFGNEYPRNRADAGLGDWQTNQEKLPNGIDFLINHAHSRGIEFGIWIEPEMVNPESVLAKTKPEWIVQSPGREKITWRNQLLLDMTNPKVQDFVYEMVDSLLSEHPGIAYIKWDANRHVEQVGSKYLLPEEQTHFWVDYTTGLYQVYSRIRDKYPDIILKSCASGGGRLDYGSLKYHHETWPSDNTDPLKRIFIQHSTNLIYPPNATGSHVSTSPNHQTGRVTPLKFRFDVAMTGRLGLELQPMDITGSDRDFASKAIQNYKDMVRPLIASGDLYRLISPYDSGNWASLMHVAKDKSKAVMFAFAIEHNNRGVFPTVKLQGIDPDANYRIVEINRNGRSAFWGNNALFSGDFLMKVGMELSISRQFDSAVFVLTKE